MRKPTLTSSAVLLAALAVPSLPSSAAADSSAPIRGLAELVDAATLARPGVAPRAAKAGERVGLGTEIDSGEARVRFRLANGGVVELMPRSRIAVSGVIDVVLGRDGGSQAARLDLKRGEATITMPTTAGKLVTIIASGDALCAVRAGSRAVLRATAEGRTHPLAVALYSGDARVATQGAWHALAPGQATRLAGGERLASPHPLSTAPAWDRHVEESSLAIVTGDSTAALRARFVPTPGATGYSLAIATPTGEVIATSELPANATEIVTPLLGPGVYFASLATRGADGFAGEPGGLHEFRVARVILPPGSSVDAGALFVPRERAPSLEDPVGLELAVGRGGFMRAGAMLPVVHDEPILAFLRMTGERESVRVSFAPRATRAVVQLSPARAVWPFDPIDVTVRVDADPAVQTLLPTLKVRVNMVAIPVTWRRDGNLFRAHIAPESTPGPWIMHVDVEDAYGSELGRGFLEIDNARGARAAIASY